MPKDDMYCILPNSLYSFGNVATYENSSSYMGGNTETAKKNSVIIRGNRNNFTFVKYKSLFSVQVIFRTIMKVEARARIVRKALTPK